MGAKGRPARNLPSYRSTDGRRRHCWVLTISGEQTLPCPGLVLEWVKSEAGEWMARVVYVPADQPEIAVQAWIAGRHLRPAAED